ncbi:MAG TPA: choice-of-anchor X domain-containing protein [Candidatus Thermoplasmatota archaeon]|nr:choice-of-anchor X domain-containing protein [Candidatus Thermoplasmatota archaeon]
MRDFRLFVLLFTLLLLFQAFPALAAPARTPEQVWDFRVENIRAVVRQATPDVYATNGHFPESGKKIDVFVKVRAYEDPTAQAAAFDFASTTKPLSLSLKLASDRNPFPGTNYNNACRRLTSIPSSGSGEFTFELGAVPADSTVDIVAVANKACSPVGQTDPGFTQYDELGDSPAGDERFLRLVTNVRPNFALHDIVCYSTLCPRAERAYGPGPSVTTRNAVVVSERPATEICWDDRDSIEREHRVTDACTDATSHLDINQAQTENQNLVYFRLAISEVGGWGLDDRDPTETQPPSASDQHSNEVFVVYPDRTENVPTETEQAPTPILIPVAFDLYHIDSDEEGRETARFDRSLTLADYFGTVITPNCYGGTKRCAQWLSHSQEANSFASPVWTEGLTLFKRAGTWELRSTINPTCGERTDTTNPPAPDSDCEDNTAKFRFHVKGSDLVVVLNLTDFQSTPYALNSKLEVGGWVENLADPNAGTSTGRAVGPVGGGEPTPPPTNPPPRANVNFFIDDSLKTLEWKTHPQDDVGRWNFLESGKRRYFAIDYRLDDVAPGTRNVRIVVDANEVVSERNETNNELVKPILIEDKIKPVLSNLRVHDERGGLIPGNPPETARGAKISFVVNVTDSDHSITNVKLKLKRPNGQDYACAGSNCTFVFKSRPAQSDVQVFEVAFPNGLPENGEWKWTVTAVDPAGNIADAVAEKVLKVTSWRKSAKLIEIPAPVGGMYPPKGDANEPNFQGSGTPNTGGVPANGSIVPYAPDGWYIRPRWQVPTETPGDPRLEHGRTPAWTSASYKVRVDEPNGNHTTYSIADERTLRATDKTGKTTDIAGTNNFTGANFASCVNDPPNGPCERFADDTLFALPFSIAATEIGVWNITLNVTDIGGEWKAYATSFRIRDRLPYGNITMIHPEQARWLKTNQTVKYRVTARDDQGYGTSGGVWLNFTHVTSNRSVNVSATLKGECAQPTDFRCLYEAAVKTGRKADGAHLNLAGRWNLTVVFKDKFGNFNTTRNQTTHEDPSQTDPDPSLTPLVRGPAYVFVNDTRAPQLFPNSNSFGTSQVEEEVGANVTFWARATDDTDFDILLTVREGAQLFADRVPMKDPDGDGNFTHELRCDAPRTFEYQVFLKDSNASRSLISSTVKSIKCNENLPPRFEVLSPISIPDAGFFAKATPVVEVRIYDTAQGVDSTSIKVAVADAQVVNLERTPSDGGRGFLVKYTHDPSKPFLHGQVINVSVEAKDLSVPPKPSTHNFTFKIDAIAPKTRIVAFDPKYVARDGHLWNVSLATRFTPDSADTEDQLPTRVKEIRYQFLRNGPGRFFTLNGTTFPMSDLPPSQNVGNGEYFVRAVGVDDVGNVEIGSSQNTIEVYLDQVPPELVRSKLKNTGRTINATFDDSGSGVRLARLHYRYDSGAFVGLDMVRQQGGAWTATVPVKSDASNVAYFLEATDNVGNWKQFGDEQSPPWSFPIGNRPPSVTILAPSDGERVSGQVTLRWEASDADGDPLTYKVYYKPANGPNELELITLNAPTSSYVVDTVKLGSGADGFYDFRVTASDGHFFQEATVRLDVQNSRDVIAATAPAKTSVSPGETLCYSARITKQGASVVEARFLLDGERVAVVPLQDNGQGCDARAADGIWSGAVQLEAAGEYDVEVYAKYIEAGEVKETTKTDRGSFTVAVSAADVLGANMGLVGVVAALAIAVLVVGGYAVFRRWR